MHGLLVLAGILALPLLGRERITAWMLPGVPGQLGVAVLYGGARIIICLLVRPLRFRGPAASLGSLKALLLVGTVAAQLGLSAGRTLGIPGRPAGARVWRDTT